MATATRSSQRGRQARTSRLEVRPKRGSRRANSGLDRTSFKDWRRTPRWLLALVAIVALVSALELACSVWQGLTSQGPQGWTLVAPWQLQLELRGTQDAPYYLSTPNRDYSWSGIPVHINARGLRTQDVALPKPAGTVRILNLGGSVAFGWGVRQEDTYGKQLEGILNARKDGHQYEVVNAATPGWGTQDEQDFLVQEGLSYDPDVVILDISLARDPRGGVAEPLVSQDASVSNWLRDHTSFWPMLTAQGGNSAQAPTTDGPIDPQDPRWDRWWNDVQDMQRVLQSRGIRFVVAPFPTADQYAGSSLADASQRAIQERAASAGILFVDVLPAYQQACQAAGSGSCEGVVNLLSADASTNPTLLGQRLAAKALGSSPLWK